MGEERVWNVGTGIWFVDTAYFVRWKRVIHFLFSEGGMGITVRGHRTQLGD